MVCFLVFYNIKLQFVNWNGVCMRDRGGILFLALFLGKKKIKPKARPVGARPNYFSIYLSFDVHYFLPFPLIEKALNFQLQVNR